MTDEKAKRFVIYEVWTRARVVEAESEDKALEAQEPPPTPPDDLHLCNWYAVAVEDPATAHPSLTPRSFQIVPR